MLEVQLVVTFRTLFSLGTLARTAYYGCLNCHNHVYFQQ
jgi:hypothetical protein